ncbi:hypothetical protein B0H16DRAFT_1731120 [Mycena metata]|uniref:Uncharacterized protein n=1 Tax=Mycena metata TaxID=1033252 RepID=A0AAD7I7J3_9AGAR|nr:hypothetical protein B0H16DRAFT_1731120 [Mycena metata]
MPLAMPSPPPTISSPSPPTPAASDSPPPVEDEPMPLAVPSPPPIISSPAPPAPGVSDSPPPVEQMPLAVPSPSPLISSPSPPAPASDTPTPEEVSHGRGAALEAETVTQKKGKLRAGNPGAADGGDGHVRCPRKADGPSMGADEDIGLMDCDDEGCASCRGHVPSLHDEDDGETEVDPIEDDEESPKKTPKKKKRKTKTGYKTTGQGPALTKDAGTLLGVLVAGIYLRETRDLLDSLLSTMGPQTEVEKDYMAPRDLTGVMKRLDLFATRSHKASFWYMVMLVQLALHVNSERQQGVKSHGRVPSLESIKNKYGFKSRRTLSRRLEAGTRLATLCAASSPYILVIIAVLDMQQDFICDRNSSTEDIIALATAFREVSHDKWGTLVKRLRMPLDYIRRNCSYLEKYDLCYRELGGDPEKPTIRPVPFFSRIHTDDVLQSLVTNFPDLPPRSECWNEPLPPWHVFTDPAQFPMPPLRTIKSVLEFKKGKSPVTWKTTDAWTEEQREVAEGTYMCTDMDDVQERMRVLHEEDGQEPTRYIGVPSDILNGGALRIEDAKGKLLAEIFTLPPELLQRLQDSIALLEAAFPGEWKDEDSRRAFFAFPSYHFTWYARYGEKGHLAPRDAKHMNNVQQDHGGRTNFTQRIPHESKEMLENLKEYSTLADVYADIFEYIRIMLEKRHPDAYEQISMYCDILPMNATSPAYPFGGFVVNIRAATSGHRDPGDELLCIVIPFGRWKAGELCLYEVGLMFDMKMGDVLLFPSCDITHFNMHFTGKRGSLVLHSDREGKGWVRDRRGWGAYVKRTVFP